MTFEFFLKCKNRKCLIYLQGAQQDQSRLEPVF